MKKSILFAVAFLAVSATTQLSAATYVARSSAIADALVDGTATIEQKLLMADAFVSHYRNEVIAAGLDPDTLTNEQKGAVVVTLLKRHVKTLIKIHNTDLATAKAAVVAADATAETDAETAYPDEGIE